MTFDMSEETIAAGQPSETVDEDQSTAKGCNDCQSIVDCQFKTRQGTDCPSFDSISARINEMTAIDHQIMF